MQFVGDAVMAVFGAPVAHRRPRRPGRGGGRLPCTPPRPKSTRDGSDDGPRAFGLGIGVTTGPGGGGAARLRGAPRVHAGRRHGQPRATPSAVGVAGPNRPQRGHLRVRWRTRPRATSCRPPCEGPGDAGRCMAASRGRGRPNPVGTRLDDRQEHMHVMEAQGLARPTNRTGRPVRALRGVDFTMDDGEFVAVMGPSGCGKSTLLNLVAGLDRRPRARSSWPASPSPTKDENELARMRRRHIGIVFQFFNLLEGMSVLENVTLPAVIAGARGVTGPRAAHATCSTCSGWPTRPRQRAGRALGRTAPAPGHRPGPGQRAHPAARRRADRRARLRGGPRGPRAVPPAARRRPVDPPRHPR